MGPVTKTGPGLARRRDLGLRDSAEVEPHKQVENLKEPTRVCQLKVPLVVRYWLLYQKVQSFEGSTTRLV
jgi:hypothetical protein